MRKIICERCIVRPTSLIQDLSAEELDEFHAYGTTAIYKPRQVIFHEGTPAAGLYVVCCGLVKLYQSNRFGRDHILGIAAPGDILGELPVDLGVPYSVSAETLSESQLCYLPRERLEQFIQVHPMVGVRLIAALSTALGAARRKAGDLALHGAETRLAALLVQLAQSGGEPAQNGGIRLTLEFSRRMMAEMIGVSTETAIRLLGNLKRKRIITAEGRHLVVADVEKLTRLANRESVAG